MMGSCSVLQENVFLAGDTIKKLYVIMACLIMLYAHIFSPIESIIAIAVIFGALLLSIETSVSLYICSIIIQIEYSELHSRLLIVYLACILLYSFFRNRLYTNLSVILVPFLLFGICCFISTMLGYKTSMISFYLVLIRLLMVMVITYYSRGSIKLFITGFVAGGLCVCLYTAYLFITGNAAVFGVSLAYGDGEAAGQIKSLAIAAAVPAYYLIYNILCNKMGLVMKLFSTFIVLVCVIVVVLTYSRGVLIALAVSSLLLLLFVLKERNSVLKFAIIFIVFFLLYYILTRIGINEEKMFGHLAGANGRTDIWSFFLSKMQDGGFLRLMFGFGPGDSKRITDGSLFDGYYSHSAILDYFFSYGILGFVFICFLLWKTLKGLFVHKNVFGLGLIILTILMFSTHGTSTNIIFTGLISICLGISLRAHQYSGEQFK